MNAQTSQTHELFHIVAAERFKRRLLSLASRSGRYVIDYLTPQIAMRIFRSLMELADLDLVVEVAGDDGLRDKHRLRAVRADAFDILPLLVDTAPDGDNVVTEGFASCLRDHFTAGSERDRLLVVFTQQGNETQKSAKEARADARIISLDQLIDELLDYQDVAPESPGSPQPIREVARAFLATLPKNPSWEDAFKRMERFLERSTGKAPEEQGRALIELGCFLPDPRREFGDKTRLKTNVERRRWLLDVLENPNVDTQHALADDFEDRPEILENLVKHGVPYLNELKLELVPEPNAKKRSKNAFRCDDLTVEGARFHKLLPHIEGPILVVSAPAKVTVVIPLMRDHSRKEHAQTIGWSDKKQLVEAKTISVSEGAREIRFELEPVGDFSVFRLALTRGPRAVANPIDLVYVVLYRGDHAEVVFEEGNRVSLERQAWLFEGKYSFMLQRGSVESPIEPAGPAEVLDKENDEGDEEEKSPVLRLAFDETRLRPHVVEVTSEDDDVGEKEPEVLIELAPYQRAVSEKKTIKERFRAEQHYLEAIVDIVEADSTWKVGLKGGLPIEVQAAEPRLAVNDNGWRHFYERAVAWLIRHPDAVRVEAKGPDSFDEPLRFDAVPQLARLAEARRAVMAALLEVAAERIPRVRRIQHAPIPLMLLPLASLRDKIDAYLEAWMAACDDAMSQSGPRDPRHEVLLQLDTVLIRGAEGTDRVTVLPTHPWLLSALAQFQTTMGKNFAGPHLALERDEVSQLVPRTIVEGWFEPGSSSSARLLLSDSAPFHWEFVPTLEHSQRSTKDYMVRIIAQKLARYVQMHPHLRHARRTLRVGFVNPGDGQHVLNGIREWLKWWQRDRLRALPLEQIPAIEVLFFRRASPKDSLGAAFDEFFRRQISASDDDTIQQALMAKLRYRKCEDRTGPTDDDTFVHVCFVHGLVDVQQQQPRQGPIDEWWDGGFGNGLLATQLRRTIAPDVAIGHFRSIRGLWVSSEDKGLRGGLARLLMLTRSRQFTDVEPRRALFWESMLPNLGDCGPTYDNSDWVVHLDRELSLEMFTQGSPEGRPSIIEYTDQEVPESPGYDTITVTKHRRAYDEQLGEILAMADLDVRGRSDEARRAAQRLLEDINALSGSWALDFLLGSVADKRYSMRLKGNIGAALTYRWLQRVERLRDGVIESDNGALVPVIVSLEDLLRVTPATGFRTGSGLVARYSNEVSTVLGAVSLNADEEQPARLVPDVYCDDLLVLYISPSVAGWPSKIYGRVIEVKLGTTASQQSTRDKAVGQVQTTSKILRDHLSGRGQRLDAMFRNKQLSLLLKSQLEQSVALGLLPPSVFEQLNVGVLSANLARGNYEVDYSFAAAGRKLSGDVFLLATSVSGHEAATDFEKDVRLVTVPRTLVEWLAFELADAPTLTNSPISTTPKFSQASLSSYFGGTKAPLRESTMVPTTAVETLPLDTGVVPTQEESAGGWAREHVEVASSTNGMEVIDETPSLSLDVASRIPVKAVSAPPEIVLRAIRDLERGLEGRRIKLKQPLTPEDSDLGPTLLRVYASLDESESIKTIRAASEDIARTVGTSSPDIHISNIPQRRAVAFDLPIAGLGYTVDFSELVAHSSFQAAQDELTLGFCAGVDMTGRPRWVDLAKMPHMLVAGTTGSGKTIFLRNIILTLMLASGSQRLQVRFASSKPMDFGPFLSAPHAGGRPMATSAEEAVVLAEELVAEMERRIKVLTQAGCDDLLEYLAESQSAMPFIVAVFDEYAEMVLSFSDKSQRSAFEGAIGRLAQKARAAGIHLILSMQRPDVGAIKGDIKANVPHRFALKVAQRQDSMVILDEVGADALLGKGDMLYRDAAGVLHRLQVPNLESAELKKLVKAISSGTTVSGTSSEVRTCPKCGRTGEIEGTFGWRRMRTTRGSVVRPQSYCRSCRAGLASR